MSKRELPSETQVQQFASLVLLLEKAYKEFAETSKKQPSAYLSILRLNLANQVLEPLQEILALVVESRFLPTFDPDEPPSNSDALFVLGQYLGATESFAKAFHFMPENEYSSRWVTSERPGDRKRDL